jgi:GWxTD domain-containing protein
LLKFWDAHCPATGALAKDFMEEYYGRVEYATKNFTGFTEGWKTDRGMIFILYGAPETIDRHPFDATGKPYDIWHYYALNREFIFVDVTGYGDYKLQYPTSDVWGRMY